MVHLRLEHVSIDLPVHGHHAASLKRTLVASATGGALCREAGVTVVGALRDICLDLREGDRLGVTGHNGAGKTTLLRVMSGAYPPTRGRRDVAGRVATLIDPALGIEPDATGIENILLRGLVMGRSRHEIARARAGIAEFSGLGDYLGMPVRTYSTGMLMRLAFSVTTAFPVDILLMDEWLAVGDAAFREQAESRIREMVDRSGILVLASHSPSLIGRECSRCITLEHGCLAKDEPVRKPDPPSSAPPPGRQPPRTAATPRPSPAT